MITVWFLRKDPLQGDLHSVLQTQETTKYASCLPRLPVKLVGSMPCIPQVALN